MQALFISIDTDAAGTWKFCIVNAFSPFSPSWYQRHWLISNLQTEDKDAIHYATASGLCFFVAEFGCKYSRSGPPPKSPLYKTSTCQKVSPYIKWPNSSG
jgi:hypothetical protein